jgi:hypothetical protein
MRRTRVLRIGEWQVDPDSMNSRARADDPRSHAPAAAALSRSTRQVVDTGTAHEVWPERARGAQSIAVAQLRRILGDDEHPKYIENLPRQAGWYVAVGCRARSDDPPAQGVTQTPARRVPELQFARRLTVWRTTAGGGAPSPVSPTARPVRRRRGAALLLASARRANVRAVPVVKRHRVRLPDIAPPVQLPSSAPIRCGAPFRT